MKESLSFIYYFFIAAHFDDYPHFRSNKLYSNILTVFPGILELVWLWYGLWYVVWIGIGCGMDASTVVSIAAPRGLGAVPPEGPTLDLAALTPDPFSVASALPAHPIGPPPDRRPGISSGRSIHTFSYRRTRIFSAYGRTGAHSTPHPVLGLRRFFVRHGIRELRRDLLQRPAGTVVGIRETRRRRQRIRHRARWRLEVVLASRVHVVRKKPYHADIRRSLSGDDRPFVEVEDLLGGRQTQSGLLGRALCPRAEQGSEREAHDHRARPRGLYVFDKRIDES